MPLQWIRRHGTRPSHFIYRDPAGRTVKPARAAQIDALAIPPGWRDVHIATSDRTPIQAWGYDTRGRKQYRYHPRALHKGQVRKYYRVRQMARDLPMIRRRVDADFRQRGLSRERVLAAVLRLISQGYFRVGNDRYAKENHTFGITTLRKSHVRVDGDTIVFTYIGKRSIQHKHIIINRELARFMQELLAAPGRQLFRYNTDGQWCDVTSRQVNEYLQTITHFPYTAKDFRTWGGTLLAATVLSELGPASSEREAKRNVVTAVRLVAAELGNTPAICRQSYVHPAVLESYVGAGVTIQPGRGQRPRPISWAEHLPEERALIHFLDTYFPERRKRRRAPKIAE